MPAPADHIDKPEPRWQAILALLAIGGIYLALPRDLVIGRAMFVYWSYDETKPFNSPIDFFTNTRWSRTGTMVK